MTVAWTRRARYNMVSLRDHIAKDSPKNSQLVAGRIVKAIELLETQPEMGRPGRVAGTREFVVPDTPFIIPYRIRRGRLQLIAVIDGHRKWPLKM